MPANLPVGTIKLPTIVQRVRVEARSLRDAEKAAKAYGDRMDATATKVDRDADKIDDAGTRVEQSNTRVERSARRVEKSYGGAGRAARDTAAKMRAARAETDRSEASWRRLGRRVVESDRSLRILRKAAPVLGKIALWTGLIGAATPGVAALGAGLAGIVGGLGPVLGALGGAIPGGIIGLGTTFGVIKASLSGVGDAVKAIGKYGIASEQARDALRSLAPEQRMLVLALLDARKQVKPLGDDIRRRLVPSYTALVRTTPAVIGAISRPVGLVADAVADTVDELRRLVGSRGFLNDMGTITRDNAVVAGLLGRALVSWVSIFRNVAVAAGPMNRRLAEAVAHGSALLDAYSGTHRGELTAFFDRAGESAISFAKGVGGFTAGLVRILGIASREFGGATGINAKFADTARTFSEWTKSARGQTSIEGFFHRMHPLVSDLWGLVKDLSRELGQTAVDQDSIDGLRELVGLARDLTPNLGELARAAGDFLKALPYSPIKEVADALTATLRATTDLIDAVPGLGDVLALLFTAALAARITKFLVTPLLKGLGALKDLRGLAGKPIPVPPGGPVGPGGPAGPGGTPPVVPAPFNNQFGKPTTAPGAPKGAPPLRVTPIAPGPTSTLPRISALDRILGLTPETRGLGTEGLGRAGWLRGLGRMLPLLGFGAQRDIVTDPDELRRLLPVDLDIGASPARRKAQDRDRAQFFRERSGIAQATAVDRARFVKVPTPIIEDRELVKRVERAQSEIAAKTKWYQTLAAAHVEKEQKQIAASTAHYQGASVDSVAANQARTTSLIEQAARANAGATARANDRARAALREQYTKEQVEQKAHYSVLDADLKQHFGSTLATINASGSAIRRNADGTWNDVVRNTRVTLDGVPAAVRQQFGSATAGINSSVPAIGKAAKKAADAASLPILSLDLRKAGYKIGASLASGLVDSWDIVGRRAVETVEKIARNIPRSPAKAGPLKGSIPRDAGRKIGEMMASGMRDGAGTVRAAAENMAAQARLATAIATVPAPAFGQIGRPGGGSSTSIDRSRSYQVQINETRGPSTPDALYNRLRTLDAILGETP